MAGAPLPIANRSLTAPRGGLSGLSRTGALVDRGGNLNIASADLGTSVVASAMSYIQSVGNTAQLKRASSITTLVPTAPGIYHDLMDNGEKAFHSGYFLEAMQDFRNANHVGIYDPESLLSLSHAHFALGQFATAGVYLAQAIQVLPELPLLPLKPRSFYGDSDQGRARYNDHMEMLRTYLQRQPDDAEAHLLLAYFLWFNQDDDPAAKALDIHNAKQSLADGLAVGRKVHVSQATTEAIETFCDGIAANGQMAGTLVQTPTSSPATTAPASGADKASTKPAEQK
jgi:tetratricopeptide (TPR) repeat protein